MAINPQAPPHGAAPGQAVQDLFGAYADVMRDAWTAGLSAMEVVANCGGPANPFAAMMAPMAEFAASIGDALKPGTDAGTGAAHAAQNAAGAVADISPAMAEAYAVASASTLRYWRALATISARHQADLVQAASGRVAGLPIEEHQTLADGVRGFFREVGDAAVQEARRLQMELDQVGERVAGAMAPDHPTGAYHRRWKAKE